MSIPRVVSAALTLAVAAFLVLSPSPSSSHALAAQPSCMDDGSGFVRMTIAGAHDFDVDWDNAGTLCTGAGSRWGVGVNFARTVDGATLSLNFTIKQMAEGATGTDLPVDVAVAGDAVGDDMFRAACTVTVTEHELIEDDGATKAYRVAGAGECAAPATGMVGGGQLTIGSFEFSGETDWPKEG